jgi:hypothetical protein
VREKRQGEMWKGKYMGRSDRIHRNKSTVEEEGEGMGKNGVMEREGRGTEGDN